MNAWEQFLSTCQQASEWAIAHPDATIAGAFIGIAVMMYVTTTNEDE